MAKNSLVAGGTSGARPASADLQTFVSIQFHYDAATQARLLELCQPCDGWLQQFRDGAIELVATPELATVMHIEACGVRFIRTKVEPARETEQRAYLELMEHHSGALIELLTLYGNVEGTTADLRRFFRKAHSDRGTAERAPAQEMALYDALLTIKAFARYVLARDLDPQPYEQKEQKTKRRTTYRRFILVADLLAAFARITGEEPTAYAGDDGRVSNAIAFIKVAMPPIVKSAKLAWAPMSDATIKNEIMGIKQFWAEGLRPELAYALPNWGRRFD